MQVFWSGRFIGIRICNLCTFSLQCKGLLSMIPGDFPLVLYRGDSAKWQFKLWSDALKTQAIDVTGATAAAEIKDRVNGIVVGAMTCTVTPPNIVDVVLSAAVAEGLPPAGVWDLQLTLASGDVWTPVAGKVSVKFDVTPSAIP
jgi:hypothetical protein